MGDLMARLDAWTAAGLVSDEQAAAIRAYEASAPPSAAPSRRGALAEAIGYVGAALALGAIAALLSQLWGDLTTGGRVALVTLLLLVLAGAATAMRGVTSRALVRLTSALWAGAVLSAGWLVGLLASEVFRLDPEVVALSVGCTLLVAGAPVLLLRPTIPAQLVTLGGAITASVAALTLPMLEPDPFWFGITVWSIGVVWLLLAHGRWVLPRLPGEVLGGIVALIATQISGVGGQRVAGLVIAVVTAGALVGLALLVDELHHLVLGAVGLFVSVPQLVFELFGDAISAPAVLLVIGLLLVVLAVGLGRASKEIRDAERRDPGLRSPRTA